MLREADPEILASYMKLGMNIMLIGPHGIGKTSILREVCGDLGWTMRDFNAATMEPHIHLVGVPDIGVDSEGRKGMDLYRDRRIDTVDVVFVDELNRGSDTTRDGVMEMVNDRAINGEKLSRLKCVVTGVNPAGGAYSVKTMDPALVDRFDVVLTMSPLVDADHLTKVLGNADLAKVFSKWQHSLNFVDPSEPQPRSSKGKKVERAPYVSPRRVEKMARHFMAIPKKRTLQDVLGMSSASLPIDKLFRDASEALTGDAVEYDPIMDSVAANVAEFIDLREGIERNQAEILSDPVRFAKDLSTLLATDDKSRLDAICQAAMDFAKEKGEEDGFDKSLSSLYAKMMSLKNSVGFSAAG